MIDVVTRRDRILITGAAGRVGSALVAGLRGRTLRLVDRRELADAPAGAEVHVVDLAAQRDLAPLLADIDAVVHLAGLADDAPWPALDRINVQPTRALAEASAAAGIRRFVYASSVHAVGAEPADARLDDAMTLRPDGPYGWSKAVGELSVRLACERSTMTGVAVRICAFQPKPQDARQLRLWLSPADLVRLVTACIESPVQAYRTAWGTSNNARLDLDRAGWQALQYAPIDDAEAFEPELRARGVDTSIVSEWPLLGGRIAAAGAIWPR